MQNNICIYCNQEKNTDEFSLEHIFPDSLGGAFANNIFKTRQVCRKCNSLSGLYVDSSFVKNFFSTALPAFSDYLGYYDFEKKPIIPFSYMGFVEYIKHPNFKYCEKWLWCGGSMVYHFHNNSEDSFETIAGGDPRKRKGKDAGEVYLVGLTDNPFWIELLLNSFVKQFQKSKKISVNYLLSHQSSDVLSTEQQSIKKEIFAIHQSKDIQKHTIPIKLDFNVRFQAKLSIGLGYSLFGKMFALSDEAKKFRDIFWNKDYQTLIELQPQMMSFFSELKNEFEQRMEFLNYKGCHGLFFIPIQNSLIFYGNLYGENQYPILTLITNELDKYQNELIEQYPEGWGYILVPQREMCIGEISIPSLLAFNTGNKSFLPELIALENLYKNLDELPPFNIDD
ncbi:MAG: HNH endonuclease [Sulfuricurvum sp.]